MSHDASALSCRLRSLPPILCDCTIKYGLFVRGPVLIVERDCLSTAPRIGGSVARYHSDAASGWRFAGSVDEQQDTGQASVWVSDKAVADWSMLRASDSLVSVS